MKLISRWLALLAVLPALALGQDLSIHQFPAGATPVGTDEFPTYQSTATKKTTGTALSSFIRSQISTSDVSTHLPAFQGDCTTSAGAYVLACGMLRPTVSTIAVGSSITLPNPTGYHQLEYVTGAAGTVLTTVTTALAMPASPLDQGTVTVAFDSAQVPLFSPNTSQSFPKGAPPSLLMQAGNAIEFYYDGVGVRGTAGAWYWNLVGSADAGLFDSAGVYQTNTLASHVETLENEVIALNGTSGSIVITSGTKTATFDVGANIAKIAAANVFSNSQQISDAEPRLLLNESDQATDAKLWDVDVNNGNLTVRTRTDADGAGSTMLTITRAGVASFNIPVLAASFTPTSSALGSGSNARINLPGAAQLGFVTSATQAGYVDSDQSLHWLANVRIDDAGPRLLLNESDQATDAKLWDIAIVSGALVVRTRTDADAAASTMLTVTRAGVASFNIPIVASSFTPSSAALGTGTNARINLPSAGQLGFVTDATQAGYFDTDQSLHTLAGIVSTGGDVTLDREPTSGGTTPTITKTAGAGSCVVGTVTGGQLGGSFVLTSGSGNCTFTISGLTTATHGHNCGGNDETSIANFVQNAHGTNSCSIAGTVNAATDVILYRVNFKW